MKGTYTITIRNRRVTFTIELTRNITIICGDSATGKTTLIQSVAFYEELGEKSGVSIDSPKSCRVLSGKNWYSDLIEITDSFVFIDEGNPFISSEEFAKAIRGTDNYYILVTRENLYQLPYSVDSILELKKTTSRFKHTYNRTYPRYNRIPKVEEKLAAFDTIITEDSNAGHDFFSHLGKLFNAECLSAGGKSRILEVLRQQSDHKRIVVADGAAFGAEMAEVYRYCRLHEQDVIIYLPESFEWLILSSGIFRDEEIASILESPADYIDSVDYMSWEQFFTALLEEKTAAGPARYTKRRLNSYYLQERSPRRPLFP